MSIQNIAGKFSVQYQRGWKQMNAVPYIGCRVCTALFAGNIIFFVVALKLRSDLLVINGQITFFCCHGRSVVVAVASVDYFAIASSFIASLPNFHHLCRSIIAEFVIITWKYQGFLFFALFRCWRMACVNHLVIIIIHVICLQSENRA